MPKMLMNDSYKNTNAYKYAESVINGDIIAGKYIIKQCEIFLNDLEQQKEEDFPWRFDTEVYDFIVGFQNFFKFADRIMAGQPMKLADFQEWILANMFCWKHKKDGYIRYSKAFIQIARLKNVNRENRCF